MRKPIVTLLSLIALLTLAISLAACSRRVEASPCTGPSGQPAICVHVVITKAATTEPLDASTFYETREVDPSVYAPDSSATSTGTITVTLTSGATVSYSTNLYYDSTTTLSPVTAGYRVLVYRPVNTASLQSFINQYKSQTQDFSVESSMPLTDISGGGTGSSTIDARGRYNSILDYHGSVNTEPPSLHHGPFQF